MHRHLLPGVLALVFTVFFIAMGISPRSREVWLAESIPIALIFVALVAGYSRFRFSDAAYVMMSVWLFLHTIGAHYTFAHVPFDVVSGWLGFERNHFDRVAHFSVGFYAFAMAEWLLRKRLCGPVLATMFSIFFIMSVAAGYEMIEWWYAVADGGEAGIEFLGSQGDIWDAQKDMLADTLGALVAMVIYWWIRPHETMS